MTWGGLQDTGQQVPQLQASSTFFISDFSPKCWDDPWGLKSPRQPIVEWSRVESQLGGLLETG